MIIIIRVYMYTHTPITLITLITLITHHVHETMKIDWINSDMWAWSTVTGLHLIVSPHVDSPGLHNSRQFILDNTHSLDMGRGDSSTDSSLAVVGHGASLAMAF